MSKLVNFRFEMVDEERLEEVRKFHAGERTALNAGHYCDINKTTVVKALIRAEFERIKKIRDEEFAKELLANVKDKPKAKAKGKVKK